MNFTKSPLSGVFTGAISTAILQSSSVTTVAAVGFVGAGLISFTQSLGIVFGVNIGTTITGWLVVLFGFKLKITTVLLPVVFIGAILKLTVKGKVGVIGYTVSGFGLIFIGISMMQEGMSSMQGLFAFDALPSKSFVALLELVGFGIIFTLITQSSSAGVAITLTAVYTGLIEFDQVGSPCDRYGYRHNGHGDVCYDWSECRGKTYRILSCFL